MGLIALCYASRAAPGVGSAALREIVEQSGPRNRADGITGCLVFEGGLFAQVLEGPEKQVHECARRIASDPRHSDLRVIWDQAIDERAFTDWTMGGVDLSDRAAEGGSLHALRLDLRRFLEDTTTGSHVHFPEFFQHCVAVLREEAHREEIVVQPPGFMFAS